MKRVSAEEFVNLIRKETDAVSFPRREWVALLESIRDKYEVGIPVKLEGFYNRSTKSFVISNSSSALVVKDAPIICNTPVINIPRVYSNNTTEKDYLSIPKIDPSFVKWGDFTTLLTIIKSGKFFPVYITGHSGNGKTMMVEQACALASRSFTHYSVSKRDDETTLIGGWQLVDGNTVWVNGIIVEAMLSGSVVLLDEISMAGDSLMAIQRIMEGKPYTIKSTGQVITPVPGFNIIACDNTKGRGSNDGKYAGAQILNEAFLDRFKLTFCQQYPSMAIEKRILLNTLKNCSVDYLSRKSEDDQFIDNLTKWSHIIRSSFDEGSINDQITTRRLCMIIESYVLFNRDRSFAINSATNRFDSDVQEAMLTLYSTIDDTHNTNSSDKSEE